MEQLDEVASFLKGMAKTIPQVGIILGTGLCNLAKKIDVEDAGNMISDILSR